MKKREEKIILLIFLALILVLLFMYFSIDILGTKNQGENNQTITELCEFQIVTTEHTESGECSYIPDVTLNLISEDSSIIRTGKTNNEGSYIFEDVPLNYKYSVTATKEGYEEISVYISAFYVMYIIDMNPIE